MRVARVVLDSLAASLRPGLLQRQGVVGVALSISSQRLIFRCARSKYCSEGCGVTAAGIEGGAGQSTLEVGNVVAQPTSNITGSNSSSLGRLGSFGCSIEGSYHLGGLAPFIGAMGGGLDADLLQALVLSDRVLACVPLDACGATSHEDPGGDQDLDQQRAHGQHLAHGQRDRACELDPHRAQNITPPPSGC